MDSLGEFVKLLLVVLRQKNIAFQMKNRKPWHVLTYRLKQSSAPGKLAFFDELWFDWDGPYPRSRELDELLSMLSITGAVETTSPRYGEWRLSDHMFSLWSGTYATLGRSDRQLLNFAAALAEEEFKKPVTHVA